MVMVMTSDGFVSMISVLHDWHETQSVIGIRMSEYNMIKELNTIIRSLD